MDARIVLAERLESLLGKLFHANAVRRKRMLPHYDQVQREMVRVGATTNPANTIRPSLVERTVNREGCRPFRVILFFAGKGVHKTAVNFLGLQATDFLAIIGGAVRVQVKMEKLQFRHPGYQRVLLERKFVRCVGMDRQLYTMRQVRRNGIVGRHVVRRIRKIVLVVRENRIFRIRNVHAVGTGREQHRQQP